jgi:nucleoside-diphosphate-sugar epimerase
MKNFWHNKKVLITGGAGFIGSHVVKELLKRGAYVSITVSPQSSPSKLQQHLGLLLDKITVMKVDLLSRSKAIAAAKGQDIILHFAALDGGAHFKKKYSALMFETNSRMGLNILESARMNAVKGVLLISSIEIYPRSTKSPITEEKSFVESFHEDISGYGWAKRFIEIAGKNYYEQYHIPIAIARLGNIYGTHDHIDPEKIRVIPAFIQQSTKGESIKILGDGSQQVSFLHTSDLVPAILDLVEDYAVADPVNIVSSHYISLKQLAEKIVGLVGSKSVIQLKESSVASGKPRKISNAKAKKVIHFKEKISLEEGLSRTIGDLVSCF